MKKEISIKKWTQLFFSVWMLCASVLPLFSADIVFAFSEQKGSAKIAIMGSGDFVPDRTGIKSGGLPDALAARVMERLSTSRRFTVMERTALRRVILEQRFGEKRPVTDVDRLMDKAITDLEKIRAGTLAVAGVLANKNDVLRDFQDLGQAAGADYLVYAKLEKIKRSEVTTAVPFSKSGRKMRRHNVDARLYLRVVDVKNGRIAGAASLRTQLSESVFGGKAPSQDELSIYDALGRQAAGKIIDMVFPARIVSSAPWVLNRGKNDGVLVGDTYEIFREGKEIKDGGGIVLGRIRSSVGKARLSQVQETISVLDVVEGSIAENDLAELSVSTTTAASIPTLPGSTLPGSTLPGVTLSGSKRKPTLAVGKVRLNRRGKNDLLSGAAIDRISNDLIVKLSQMKRFDVMERQEVDQILDEKLFKSMTSGEDIEVSLGTLVEADYLVLTTVDDFYIRRTKRRIAALDEIQIINKGIVEASLRIVDVHSSKVLAANKVRINQRLSSNEDSREVMNNFIDQFTSRMVGEIISNLFPGEGDALIKATMPTRKEKKIRKVTKPSF